MKKNKLFSLILYLVLFLIFFVGCQTQTTQYTIRYEDENGIVYEEIKVKEGDQIKLFEPTKEGYTFNGWYLNGEVVSSLGEINKDVVLTANWVINQYTYKFIVNNEIIKEVTAPYNSVIEYPEDPILSDTDEISYIFSGWDNDASELHTDEVFNAIILEVKKKYTYSFILDDGTVLKEESVEYGTMPVAPTNVEKKPVDGKEFVFVGWDKEISKVVENVVYTAVFEEIEPTLEGLKLSIFGDSISTFYSPDSSVNSYYTGNLQYFYPDRCPAISTVDLTWWYKLYNSNNMLLGVNNSWSGSCAYGVNNVSAGMHDDRLDTVDENGTPDLVIIYMGTNDLAKGYSVEEFSLAIQTMITKIRNKGVKEIFLFTLGYTDYSAYNYTEEGRLAYNEELRRLATINDCGVIPLDEYIIDDNFMIYLSDKLHYNAKGADLISKVAEKSIKEYYGIEYDKEIEVEHKESIPEGYVGKVVATANSDFYSKYETDIFFAPANTFLNPIYSDRYQISKKEDGTYYVSSILKSGESGTYNCEYVIVLSASLSNYQDAKYYLSKVEVGCSVEFNYNEEFPMEILFGPVVVDTNKTYTYKFVSDDGTVLAEETVKYGTMPVAPINITKESVDGKVYIFVGWDKEIKEVVEDVIYTAVFKVEQQKPDNCIAHITATTKSDFYNKYTTDVFFAKSSEALNPIYSDRYQIKKNEDGNYYVCAISKSGESLKYDCEYVLYISSAIKNYSEIKKLLADITVGCLVEFDDSGAYPVEIFFIAN